jgi:hypothetical protein
LSTIFPGIYWVKVTTASGWATDTINVVFENCDCELYVPNVFTLMVMGLMMSLILFLNANSELIISLFLIDGEIKYMKQMTKMLNGTVYSMDQ